MEIKNINKKLIAGILTVTLLAGCSSESHGLPTETTAKGEVVYSTVEFNDIRNWKVVVFEFNGQKSFYLTEKINGVGKYGSTTYYDVFGGESLYVEGNKNTELSILMEAYLTDYLITYGKVQGTYTEKELKEILEQIKAEYELQQANKQLVIGN